MTKRGRFGIWMVLLVWCSGSVAAVDLPPSRGVSPAFRTPAAIEQWVGQVLRGEESPEMAELFSHEDALIEQAYGHLGKGLFKNNPKTLRAPSQTAAALQSAWNRMFGGSSLVRRARKLFSENIEPLMAADFPQLLAESNARYLHKVKIETTRNFYFAEWTRRMHGSPVPEMAKLYLSVAHPIYDAMFDQEIVPNSPYSLKERLVRATRIIARDYELTEPLLGPEKLLIQIVRGLERTLPEQNRELYFDYLFKLNLAQLESVRQRASVLGGAVLDNETLRLIELRKGGYSMHVYVLLADRKFSQHELDTFFLEGAMLQLVDDSCDVREDFEDGVDTLIKRRLAAPAELWEMRDIWFERLDAYVKNGDYDGDEVDDYRHDIDVFLHLATEAYSRDMGIDAAEEERNFFEKSLHYTGKGVEYGLLKPVGFILGNTVGIPLKFLFNQAFPIFEEIR